MVAKEINYRHALTVSFLGVDHIIYAVAARRRRSRHESSTHDITKGVSSDKIAREQNNLCTPDIKVQIRDCTADHCPLLHCRKDEERTAPKIL
jgi:hypothetical protein